MKTKLLLTNIALLALLGSLVNTGAQVVPGILNYQGRLAAAGTNFDGTAQFKFALVNGGTDIARQATATATVANGFIVDIIPTFGGIGYVTAPAVTITDPSGSNAVVTASVSGGAVVGFNIVNNGRNYSASPTVTLAPPPPSYTYVTYWSHDGTSTAGSEPGAAVSVPVRQGLFAVNLGDTSLANMTAPIPTEVFTNSDVRLRLWVSDGVSGFTQLSSDQRLTAAGYAMVAERALNVEVGTANLANGSVTSIKLADAGVTQPKLGASGGTSGQVLSTDGSNLVWQTLPSVMSAVLANDGSGSGLDADLLDGYDSTAFAPVTHAHSAGQITSGLLDDARLSGNVALRNTSQVFSGSNLFSGISVFANAANTFAGNGAALTSLNANNLTAGTLPDARVAGTYSSAVNFNNANNRFTGDGSGLTQLNANNLSQGTVPGGRLSGTYFNGVNFNNPGNSFTGSGAGLSGLDANALANGRVPDPRLGGTYSSTVHFNNWGNSFSGTFGGDGAGLSNLNASALASGTVLDARLGTNVAFLNASPKFVGSVSAGGDLLGTRLNVGTNHNLGGDLASIAGGRANTNQAPRGSVGGGEWNAIETGSTGANISGGRANQIHQYTPDATIGGGTINLIRATASAATIGGGNGNVIEIGANYATISGGWNNTNASAYATIGGGLANKILNGIYSTIGGGAVNLIDSGVGYATIAGGNDNSIALSDESFIGGGYNNTIQSNSRSSTIAGGNNNLIQANAPYASIPGGREAKAKNYGEMAYASGDFATVGDAQTSLYVLRTTTLAGIATEMFLDNIGARLTVPNGGTWTFDILITARSSAGANSAGYRIHGVIENVGGAVAFVGVPAVTILGEDVVAWDASVRAWANRLEIWVTGNVGATVRWVARVSTAEVIN